MAHHRLRVPVAVDADAVVWRAFENRHWPALYVLDRRGKVRSTVVGEVHEGTPRCKELIQVIERLRKEPA